mmetsp:Transcript_47418/g.125792  ORF Transcript_47418/g.125792 Transcript_47418/m.125792 type:complete len:94 (-) Transcript_47418:280-561(-)
MLKKLDGKGQQQCIHETALAAHAMSRSRHFTEVVKTRPYLQSFSQCGKCSRSSRCGFLRERSLIVKAKGLTTGAVLQVHVPRSSASREHCFGQ